MRLLSKYLLLLFLAPLMVLVISQAIAQSFLFIGTLLIGQLLPFLGMFSGMVGSNEIFKELLKYIVFSILTLGFSLGALYFSYKFSKMIWHDFKVKLNIMFSYLCLIFILIISSVITGTYVTNYFSKLQLTSTSSEILQPDYSLFFLLFNLLPYGLLLLFYTHQRDKGLSV